MLYWIFLYHRVELKPYAEVIPSGNNDRLHSEIDQLDEIEPYEIDNLRARGYANITSVMRSSDRARTTRSA